MLSRPPTERLCPPPEYPSLASGELTGDGGGQHEQEQGDPLLGVRNRELVERLDEEPVEGQEGGDGREHGGSATEDDCRGEDREKVQHRGVGEVDPADDEADEETDERHRRQRSGVAHQPAPPGASAPVADIHAGIIALFEDLLSDQVHQGGISRAAGAVQRTFRPLARGFAGGGNEGLPGGDPTGCRQPMESPLGQTRWFFEETLIAGEPL